MLVPMKKRLPTGIAGPALTLALALLAAWAFWLEPDSLRTVEYPLALRQWPAAQDGLRIAVITDLHAGAPFIDHRKVLRVVSETLAARPDLILLPGDFVIQEVVGGHVVSPEHIASWLSPLQAPLGVYAVLGNHDNALGSERVRAAFESVHIPVLDERSLHLTGGRFDFWLSGLADFVTHDPDLRKLPPPDGLPIVAVTHSPDVMPELPARVNLLIAGHTHGGQVRLPLIGALKTSSRYGRRYQIGHIVEQTDLFVCPGIGTSILPVRFLDPPEICVLTLTGGGTSATEGAPAP